MALAFLLSATDKMSRVVEQATKKSSQSLSAFERTASKVSEKSFSIGKKMTAAGVGLGASILGVTKMTSDYGDSVWKASQKVGIGVENWQKLAYAARYSNVEQEALTSGMVFFNKLLVNAANGAEKAQEPFKNLGIEIKDAAGNIRPSEDIIRDWAAVFSKVEDGAEKTALAAELFGRTAGANLIPLLNSGAEGLEAMYEEAERMGFVMSAESAKACEEFNDNLSRVTDSMKGAGMQMGTAFMPMLDKLAKRITAVTSKMAEWIKQNPVLASQLGKVALAVSGVLTVLGGLALAIGAASYASTQFVKAWKLLKKAVAVGKTLFIAAKNSMVLFRIQYAALIVAQKLAAAAQWLFNASLFGCPVVLIIAGVAAVCAAAYLLVKNWDKVSAFFSGLWEKIKKIFSAVWDWIKKMFLNYTPYGLIIKHWDKIKAWFSSLWGKTKQIFSSAWAWIKKMFLNYTPHGLIIKHWSKISGWFASLWGKVKQVFSSAWDGIKNLFLNYTPYGLIIKHWDNIPEYFRNIWNKVGEVFSSLKERFSEFGINIITGLIDGITSKVTELWDSVKNIGEKIASTFKEILGINSPSRIFLDYGVNITDGLIGGLEKGGQAVESATGDLAMQAISSTNQTLQTNTAESTSIFNASGGSPFSYSPVINIYGNATESEKEDFSQLLKKHAKEITDILNRYNSNKTRLAF